MYVWVRSLSDIHSDDRFSPINMLDHILAFILVLLYRELFILVFVNVIQNPPFNTARTLACYALWPTSGTYRYFILARMGAQPVSITRARSPRGQRYAHDSPSIASEIVQVLEMEFVVILSLRFRHRTSGHRRCIDNTVALIYIGML